VGRGSLERPELRFDIARSSMFPRFELRLTLWAFLLGAFSFTFAATATRPASQATMPSWEELSRNVVHFPAGPCEYRTRAGAGASAKAVAGPATTPKPNDLADAKFPPLATDRQVALYEYAYGPEEREAAAAASRPEKMLEFVQTLRARAGIIRDPVLKRYTQLRAFALARRANARLQSLQSLDAEIKPLLSGETPGVLLQRAELAAALAEESGREPVVDPEARDLALSAATAYVSLATWQVEHDYLDAAPDAMERAAQFLKRCESEELERRLGEVERVAQRRMRALAGGDAPAEMPSKRIAVIIDGSGSMMNRMSALRDQATRIIHDLQPAQDFSVIVFREDTAITFSAGLLSPATPANKQRAEEFIQALAPSGSSDPTEALRRALRSQVDVIWFLSDGDVPDASKILRSLRIRMAGVRTRINTIAIGDVEEASAAFLKHLSVQTGGEFRSAAVP
jgi:hypothetical protein